VGGLLLVDLSRGVVLVLGGLVRQSVLASLEAAVVRN
jgi:hypothetical protein